MLTNSEMVLSEAVMILGFLHKYFILRISLEARYQECGALYNVDVVI